MTTETLSKVIGIRLPKAIMDAYEAEYERTTIPVATLVRRDLLRLFAAEDATNGSEDTSDNGTSDAHGQHPGVKQGAPDHPGLSDASGPPAGSQGQNALHRPSRDASREALEA